MFFIVLSSFSLFFLISPSLLMKVSRNFFPSSPTVAYHLYRVLRTGRRKQGAFSILYHGHISDTRTCQGQIHVYPNSLTPLPIHIGLSAMKKRAKIGVSEIQVYILSFRVFVVLVNVSPIDMRKQKRVGIWKKCLQG